MNIKTKSSYEEAIQTLTSQGKFYINLGLERVTALLERYDNPQDKIKCIHVAGTNGKGSTCAMIAAILKESGYKIGLYTSPHLVDYTERIKINDKDISREEFADLISDIIQIAKKHKIHATEFEILTAAAFVYFEKEKVDFSVIETGLGGRFDATNIIKNPLMSIITSIDKDHTDRLGSTIEKIAYEKAGIIKSGIPVITLKNNNGIEVIKEKALKTGGNLILTEEFSMFDLYESNLKGLWQKKNLSLAVKSAITMRGHGIAVPEKAIRDGLKNVSWSGRFQYIKEKNLILDGAHNPAAAKLLRETLDLYYPDKKRIWIYSSLNTKNYPEVMEILFGNEDTVIFTKPTLNAAVSPKTLKANLNKACKIYITENIEKAVNLYSDLTDKETCGIIAGSLYVVGDFIKEFYPDGLEK